MRAIQVHEKLQDHRGKANFFSISCILRLFADFRINHQILKIVNENLIEEFYLLAFF